MYKRQAYVCDLTPEEIREYRGTLTEPGKNSPYRERSVEENLELFEAMKDGKFKDGEKAVSYTHRVWKLQQDWGSQAVILLRRWKC